MFRGHVRAVFIIIMLKKKQRGAEASSEAQHGRVSVALQMHLTLHKLRFISLTNESFLFFPALLSLLPLKNKGLGEYLSIFVSGF